MNKIAPSGTTGVGKRSHEGCNARCMPRATGVDGEPASHERLSHGVQGR